MTKLNKYTREEIIDTIAFLCAALDDETLDKVWTLVNDLATKQVLGIPATPIEVEIHTP